MELTRTPSSRPPALAVAAGVLGLAAAAVAVFGAFLLMALGGLQADNGEGRWWALVLLVVGAAQAWAAVRLLRRRGWLPLALASLPGLLPLAGLVVVWLEYRQDPTVLEAVAAIPLLTLVLTLTSPVRRWATPVEDPARADSTVTPSGV